MAIDQPILSMGGNTVDEKKVLSSVYISDGFDLVTGDLLYYSQDGEAYTTPIDKVNGIVLAVPDPDIPGVATLYVLQAVVAQSESGLGPGDSRPSYKWWPTDLFWPKIDPNTGQNYNTNLEASDPNFVQPEYF